MSNINQFQLLYAYHFDTSLCLIVSAQNLAVSQDAKQYEEENKSIHSILFHTLSATRSWRIALETGKRPDPLQDKDYSDLTSLKQAFEQEKLAWEKFLASLNPEQINQDVELKSAPDRVFTFKRWKIIQHVALHGMQHHAEIAALLTRANQSPGDIDFIFYS